MDFELRLPEKRKHSLRELGKRFWIPVFLAFAGLLGVGTYLFLNARASTGTVTVNRVSSTRTRSDGTTVNTSLIRYGTDESNTTATWGTYRYNVVTSSDDYTGMCLQPNITGPDGESFSLTVDTSTYSLITKEIMLVSIDGLDSTIQSAFESANPDFWDDLSLSVSNLRYRTRGSTTGYAPYYYTDYYYGATWSGCGSVGSSSDCTDISKSKVPYADYIYALGHMMIGSYVNEISYGLTVDETNTVEDGARAIVAWFDANPTYKTRASEYDLYTTVVDETGTVQKIGWLEYAGPSTPTRIRIYKASTTGTALSGAVFSVNGSLYTTSGGYTDWIEVDAGTITYYETTAPTGYTGYSLAQTCTAVSQTDVTCPAVQNQKIASAYVKIKKVDSETLSASSRGSVSVAGSVYGVYNSAGTQVTTITIDSDGTGTSAASLSEGTYYIQETTAPTGYTANSTQKLTFSVTSSDDGTTKDLTSSSTVCTSSSTSACYFTDTIIKGAFSLTKTGYELSTSGSASSRNLGGVYFTAVNKSDS